MAFNITILSSLFMHRSSSHPPLQQQSKVLLIRKVSVSLGLKGFRIFWIKGFRIFGSERFLDLLDPKGFWIFGSKYLVSRQFNLNPPKRDVEFNL
jgi:hypothetical protein